MNRECRLLVLSPRARSESHAQQYRPFNDQFLSALLAKAEKLASTREDRNYDCHRVFGGFFFGMHDLDGALKNELNKAVPTCLLDCSVFRDGEPNDLAAAKNALHYLTYGHPAGGKMIVLACRDGCQVDTGYQVWPADNDGMLVAYLWSDLCDNVFKRMVKVMGKRSDD